MSGHSAETSKASWYQTRVKTNRKPKIAKRTPYGRIIAAWPEECRTRDGKPVLREFYFHVTNGVSSRYAGTKEGKANA